MGTRATTLEGGSGSAPKPAKDQAPEEKTIREVVNDPGRTRVRSGRSGGESSGGAVGGRVVEQGVKTWLLEPEISGERSTFRDLNVGLSDSELGGLVESSLLKLRGSESVEKLESFSSNEKKAVRDGAWVEENGSSLDEIDEDPIGKHEIIEAETGVNGGVEENGSFLDEVEEDPDGKHEIIDAKNGVNGGAEENESSCDDIEEDLDGKFEITEDVGEEGHEFSVGDFVWGKIKSHPWWPGQVCDPSDASEYAVKLKPKDRLLVTYFGDGTFAWCHPLQLKPFEENFQEMSKQSSSKAFVHAVQQAVDEIGRLVRLKMSCRCVREEFLGGLSQPLALNAGIKEGILVPEGRVGKVLDHLSEPADLLAELKHVAQDISVTSDLELNVVKSYLSAFYCSKGGYQLPTFIEAQPVPGLEDDWKVVEVPVQGPLEDWLSSPIRIKAGLTNQTFSQSSPQLLENRQYDRRKQKSIADILGAEDDIQGNTKDGGDGEISEKPRPSSRQKKKHGSEIQSESNLSSESEKRSGRLSRSRTSPRIKKVLIVEADYSGSKEETKKGPLSRRRKKDEGIGTDSNHGEAKEESGDSPISRDGELRNGGLQSDLKDRIDSRTLSRERKRSKYLSPPFTDLNMGKRKRDIEVEVTEVSSAANSIGSPQMFNSCTDTLQKRRSTELGLGQEITSGSSPKTPTEYEKKSIDPMKVNASTSQVLSKVRTAAVNPSYPIKEKSFAIARDFMSVFRDSIYCNGSNYELYHQPHRKRKNMKSEPASLGKDENQTAENLLDSDREQKKIKKSQERKSDKTTEKQAAETPSSKPGRQNLKDASGTPDLKTRKRKKKDETTSPASLFVTFGPGSSLPTKADLIKIYSKFGELNETETEMFYNNFCARVSFGKISDAEEAFNHSLNDSPFGASNVNFRLHKLSATSKIRELSEISNSPPAKSRGKTKTQPLASEPPVVGEASQLDFIRHKLEMMTSMLGSSDGKVSAVTKSKLESEIKELLETVSTMVESSS